MPTKLRKLKITQVAVCPQGANPDADIVLFKSAEPPHEPVAKAYGTPWEEALALATAYQQERGCTLPEALYAVQRAYPALYQAHLASQGTPHGILPPIDRGGVSAAEVRGMPGYMKADTSALDAVLARVDVLKAEGMPHVRAWGEVLADPAVQAVRNAYYASQARRKG